MRLCNIYSQNKAKTVVVLNMPFRHQSFHQSYFKPKSNLISTQLHLNQDQIADKHKLHLN